MQPLEHVPLAPQTTLGVGGQARWYVRVESVEAARQALQWAMERALPVFVLGGGSNLVVADAGWPGLVLHLAVAGVDIQPASANPLLVAGAGEPWDRVVAALVARGLAGVECLSGIPGTVGGTPVQNVGAYGQEVAGVLDHVVALDTTTGGVVRLANAGCGFGYRMSRFKGADAGRFIIAAVAFRLREGPPTVTYPDLMAHMHEHAIMSPAVADVREAVLAVRRRKAMLIDAADPDTRSVGSFFMNPVVGAAVFAAIAASAGGDVPSFPAAEGQVKVPAAWLVERAGFARGFAAGAAGVSSKHPLAIVNRGGASAGDIVALASRIKRQVADRFGIWLRTEPVFVGFGEDADVRFLQKVQG